MASRLLIAVGESPSSPEHLPFGVRTLLDAAQEILVIAPTLPKRFEWLASATDKAREQADERLRAALGQLDAIGDEAAGIVGSDDVFVAFEDAIREFSPDHLLIALRGQDRADWQERGLLDQLFERFGVPMTVFSSTTHP
jgi:hypothetical protein